MENENAVTYRLVKCHVCDSKFHFREDLLQAMKTPSTFCERCFKTYDLLTLRQWFKLDMLVHMINVRTNEDSEVSK